MKKTFFRVLTLLVLILPIYLTFFANKNRINSLPPTSIRDVLSNSQLSYYGGVGVGNSANENLIKIDTGTSFPSRTTANLFIGDTISIGLGGSQSTYYVKDIGNTRTITLNTGLSAVAIPYGGSIISTRSAIHTIYFTPGDNGAYWQFLIRASAIGGTDRIPDMDGFDAGALTNAAITCPFGGGAATLVGTTTTVSSGSPLVTAPYNIIQCPAGAGSTNPVGVGGSVVIGVGPSMLINPSKNNATEGSADILTFIVRQLDGSSIVINDTFGKIAVVESVRVTATVDPTLTFTIDNVGANSIGSSACGAGTSLASGAVNTTGSVVPFGSLTIGTTGNQLAQRLSCLTNASGGYVVTAYENAVMKNINTATTLPDTTCNATCSYTTAQAWTNASTSKSEFGYTMFNVNSSIPFTAGNFKAFGQGFSQAQNIMQRTSLPATSESAYVCYRITVHTGQEAGDYESRVTYTATATF